MIIAKQSTSRTIQLGPFVDSTDGYTPESGLSVTQATVKLSKAGAVFAQKNDSNSGTYDANGYYRVALNTTDTNTVGILRVSCQITGALPVEENLLILPAAIYEALINSGPYGVALYRSTVASVTSQTNLTCSSAIMSDNLTGCRIVIRKASNGTVITGIVTGTTAGEEVTFDVDGSADFTITSGDTVEIMPPGFSVDTLLAYTNGADTVGNQLAAVSAGTVSPYLVDADHTWRFGHRAEITSPNIIQENIGFSGLLQMDFTEPLPKDGSISSITTTSVADVSGATEPTISSSAVSADKKKVVLTVATASATAATYTFSVKIVTTDSQTIVRKGQLLLA